MRTLIFLLEKWWINFRRIFCPNRFFWLDFLIWFIRKISLLGNSFRISKYVEVRRIRGCLSNNFLLILLLLMTKNFITLVCVIEQITQWFSWLFWSFLFKNIRFRTKNVSLVVIVRHLVYILNILSKYIFCWLFKNWTKNIQSIWRFLSKPENIGWRLVLLDFFRLLFNWLFLFHNRIFLNRLNKEIWFWQFLMSSSV